MGRLVTSMCPAVLSPDKCADYLAHLASALSSVVTAAALIIAGVWALLHFYRRRELRSKVDLTVGIEFLGNHPGTDHIVVQVIADLKNTGTVRHKISKITYSLRVLRENDSLMAGGKDILEQLVFPTKIVDDRLFFPEEWQFSFVEAGVTNTYRSVTTIPGDTRLVLATAWFAYAGEDEFHKSERVFRVPNHGSPEVKPG